MNHQNVMEKIIKLIKYVKYMTAEAYSIYALIMRNCQSFSLLFTENKNANDANRE